MVETTEYTERFDGGAVRATEGLLHPLRVLYLADRIPVALPQADIRGPFRAIQAAGEGSETACKLPPRSSRPPRDGACPAHRFTTRELEGREKQGQTRF